MKHLILDIAELSSLLELPSDVLQAAADGDLFDLVEIDDCEFIELDHLPESLLTLLEQRQAERRLALEAAEVEANDDQADDELDDSEAEDPEAPDDPDGAPEDPDDPDDSEDPDDSVGEF